MEENDNVPHGVIITLHWESHEKKPDGTFAGASKDQGNQLFVLEANDKALVMEYLKELLNLIKEKTHESTVLTTQFGQSQVSGTSESREQSPGMFGMRGIVGRNSIGGPGVERDVQVSGRLSALRRP